MLHYWRTSEASETLSGVTQLKIVVVCRRASETVFGVDNAKSGICYLASERSERATLRYVVYGNPEYVVV